MTRIAGCRSCESVELLPVLAMGEMPLANALLGEADLEGPEATYPLELVFCPACSLLQITETVPPEALFSDYPYFSSFSDTMVAHAKTLAEDLTARRSLGRSSRVVEVASNDGYLLQWYQAKGIPVLGIEPALNVAKTAVEERGIETRCAFFGRDLATELVTEGIRADVIHAHNVLAHVPDLRGVVEGFRTLLAPRGCVVVEAPYARDMIDHVEFDTIYHEHLCYFSLTALHGIFERCGLSILDAERDPIHGGTLRITAERTEDAAQPAPAVAELLAEESDLGMTAPGYYRDFAARVEALREELNALLDRLHAEGKRVAVYGASAKGSTLMNYFGIGRDRVSFVADRSTVKQGRYTPGTHLPIVPPERLLEEMPDFTLLLVWNFKDEVLAQQAAYCEQGGRFIVPVPAVEILP